MRDGDSDQTSLSNNGQLRAGKSIGSSPAATVSVASAPVVTGSGGTGAERASLALVPDIEQEPVRVMSDLEDVRAVIEEAGEIVLASEIYNHVELVQLSDGVLEIAVRNDHMSPRIKGLQKVLSAAAGRHWVVSFVPETGVPTLAELADIARKELFGKVLKMPIMEGVMKAFPEAQLVDVSEINKGDE